MYLKTQIENLLRLAQEQESYEPYHKTLEYVRGVDNSTFLTDFYPTNNTRVEFRALNIDSTSFETYSRWFIGARAGYLNKQFGFYFNIVDSPNKLYCCLNNKQDSVSYTPSQIYGDHTFMMDNTGLYIDGTKIVTSSATGSFTCDYPLVIGGLNNGGDITIPPLCDYTYIKIWENNVLVHDYIPALNNKMQPCLYDRVTKTFLNAITRDTKEPIYELSFKRWNKFDVDYIEGTGTQYIDTGYAFTDDFSWELDFSDLTGTSCTLFGGRTSNARTALLYKNLDTVLSGEITCPIATYNGSQTPFTTGLYSNSGRHKVKMSVANNKATVWVDDEIKHNNVSFTGTYISGTTQALFGDNFGGTTGVTELASAKVYGLTMWQGTQVVRDYKPVIWHNGNTTAVACLYDEVYNKMYQNAGTGTLKAYIENTLGESYEVGMYLKTIKTGNSANVGPIVELGEYPQDGMGYHIKTTTDSTSSNYLFGSRLTTSGNLAIATLLGSSTGGTILSGVMGGSITWKSGTTTWARSGNGTTYECSLQTYKDGNTYKFDVIGYNYTLGKEADRQTQTYPSPIDEQQNAPMLLFGAVNTINILFGNNSHYFVEWNLPNVRHTLLPVINSTHTKICFIDNRTKQIYEFTKVGTYTPTTNNITFKQLDGTIITGTLT